MVQLQSRGHWSAWSSRAGAFLLACGMACSGCTENHAIGTQTSGQVQSSRQKPAREPRMELQLVGTTDDPVLAVTLSNDSQSVITVDRELVFGIDIEATGIDGSVIEAEYIRRLDRPWRDAGQWRRRFRQLLPGEVIRRDIALKKAYRCFVALRASSIGPKARVVHPRVSAYEAEFRLPESVRLSEIEKITVTYSPCRGVVRDGFVSYTGLQPSDIGLFGGSLTAAIRPTAIVDANWTITQEQQADKPEDHLHSR